MPTVTLPTIDQNETDINTMVKKLLNAYVQLNEEMTYLLSHLDTKNVNELNAEVIVAGSITSDKIKANSITADKLNVTELSAITANLGHIISGLIESVQIFGSYIATSQSYPRAEMSNTNNMIGAYKSSNNALQIYSPSDMFSPTIKFITPAGVAYITYLVNENAISLTSDDANINISSARRIELFSQEGVYVTGWTSLRHNGTGHSLEDDFVRK